MGYKAFGDRDLGFTTRQLHAGYNPGQHNMAKAVPIYQNAAFQFNDFDRCGRLFAYEEDGYSYGRYSNPTTEALERRVESLEGCDTAGAIRGQGDGADSSSYDDFVQPGYSGPVVAMASGMAAVSGTMLNLAAAGDNIVAAPTLYGGDMTLLTKILPQYGIQGKFSEDPTDPASFEAMIDEGTKAVFVECLSNPNSYIVDFESIAEIAHAHGVPLVVDNTFATPYLFRPFEHGADIVIYSATKYLAGHGILVGGLAVEKGGFDWLSGGRYPWFEKFYEENKISISEDKLRNYLFSMRLRMTYLCDLGAYMSPQTAFYILQGMETLSLRMERHVENALKVARFLEAHLNVKSVSYPGLPTDPGHALAKKYFPRGAGAIVSFRVSGGIEAAKRVISRCELFDFMVNVGDVKSLIVHPATSTHFGQSDERKLAAGVYEDTIRLSVGIEDAEDLIDDLAHALD
ncbi:MAG: O-acetylhomoserine aminocarboxypropyltransferase/cysteine synthase [Clostridiales Family XIII bacterium]|nr:O-acetylhomoserine aminocarboxypropyltransferase/cysteine synthase [Clostridiales Family XIII bacterium]